MNLDLGIGMTERLKQEFVSFNQMKRRDVMNYVEVQVRTKKSEKKEMIGKINNNEITQINVNKNDISNFTQDSNLK